MKVDRLLALLEFPGVDPGVDAPRRVRVLFAGGRDRVLRGLATECRVLAQISTWSKREIDKLRGQLESIASMPEIPFGKNIKRVGGAHKIVELRVDKRRVYGFVDATTGETMICACSQSVNRGDKSAMQEAAIREAEELRGRWLSAKHLPGFEDVRVE